MQCLETITRWSNCLTDYRHTVEPSSCQRIRSLKMKLDLAPSLAQTQVLSSHSSLRGLCTLRQTTSVKVYVQIPFFCSAEDKTYTCAQLLFTTPNSQCTFKHHLQSVSPVHRSLLANHSPPLAFSCTLLLTPLILTPPSGFPSSSRPELTTLCPTYPLFKPS